MSLSSHSGLWWNLPPPPTWVQTSALSVIQRKIQPKYYRLSSKRISQDWLFKCMHVCVSTWGYVSVSVGVCGDWRKGSGLLELQFQEVVSSTPRWHGCGELNPGPGRAASTLNPLISPELVIALFRLFLHFNCRGIPLRRATCFAKGRARHHNPPPLLMSAVDWGTRLFLYSSTRSPSYMLPICLPVCHYHLWKTKSISIKMIWPILWLT